MFRRARDEQEVREPNRGPGGGKVRPRPRRRERNRKPAGVADALFVGVLFSIFSLLLYHFIAKYNWLASGALAVVVLAATTTASFYMSKRKQAKAAAAPPPRRRR